MVLDLRQGGAASDTVSLASRTVSEATPVVVIYSRTSSVELHQWSTTWRPTESPTTSTVNEYFTTLYNEQSNIAWANLTWALTGNTAFYTGSGFASLSQVDIRPLPATAVPSTSTAASSVVTSGTLDTSLTQPAMSTSNTSQNSQTGNPDVSRPTSFPSTQKANTGISSRAAAGIAIGCLIAGAIVTGLLAWFCLGRARRRRDTGSEPSAIALINSEKGGGTHLTPLGGGNPLSQIAEAGLPQPLEDKAISGEVSKISNLIKNHVQSFYHANRSAGLLDIDDLQALGRDLPITMGTLSTLLNNSNTREIALRFCIAWVVVSRMEVQHSSANSLLPPEVVESYNSMAFVDRASRVQQAFFARWRMLTAELMQSNYVRNAFSASDRRILAVRAAMDDLEGILAPFADPRMDRAQRIQNLEELVKRSAKFGFVLFSQPSTWDFDWQDQQGVASGGLCVFPALVQVTDESGEAIAPPRSFSEAVVRRLDG